MGDNSPPFQNSDLTALQSKDYGSGCNEDLVKKPLIDIP